MFIKFPKGFLWGSATSSHQVEGRNFNNWSIWELSSAKLLAKKAESKKWPYYILEQDLNPVKKENYVSGRATDHYNQYEGDFDIAKKLNHSAHRFSIEWSRIEPEEGKFDEREIEHYRNVLKSLRERGIEPFVTLWHWTEPLWFSQKGGFENPKSPFYFQRYTEKVILELGDLANFWITINEPLVVTSHAYLRGLWPPQKKSAYAYFRVLKNLIRAHKASYKKIKAFRSDIKIGVAYHFRYFEAYKNKFFNRVLKYFAELIVNRYFIRRVRRYQDFIGFNYYGRNRFKFNLFNPTKIVENENEVLTDMGWEIYPDGIYYILKDLKKYNLPIYITENGLADTRDEYRIDFIKGHLYFIHKAIEEGVDVRGYLYWSLLDNFEWDKGFWPRFGLVEVNYKTLERKVRYSTLLYGDICEKNGFEV